MFPQNSLLVQSATMSPTTASQKLKILPAYTGTTTIEEALTDPRSLRVLWLEILFNDQLKIAPILQHSSGRAAYEKACRWYTAYRSLIESVVPRSPLPRDTSAIDPREHRIFLEALHFVHAQR